MPRLEASAAAVSATRPPALGEARTTTRSPGSQALSRRRDRVAGAPVPGTYIGVTEGPAADEVTFRFLGTGVRDLAVGGRIVAQWVPIARGVGTAFAGSARIRLRWVGDIAVEGAIQRGRGRRTEESRFSARHRFHDLSG